MQAAQIRDKYKRILEEPEEEDNSEDQWEIAYSQMTKQRKKKILTESSLNLSASKENQKETNTLTLKQKLAQCLSNCKEHCHEIQRLKREQIMFQEQRLQWQNQSTQYTKLLEDQKQIAKNYLQKIRDLECQNHELQSRCQQFAMDRQLQQKQAEFYKAQLSKVQTELEKKEREFKACEKEMKSFEKVKKQNEYLKNDVERLGHLIDDSLRFGRVSGELMKKHFLGKPHREMDYWYPQQLVGQVEHFLKKSQVGHGNKEFTTNLIKFIEKVQQKSKEENQKGPQAARYTSNSKPKDKDCLSLKKTNKLNFLEGSTKKNSYNLSSMRDQHLLRSNTNSFWKANESRVISTSNIGVSSLKNLCWDVVNEFRSVVFQLLLQKDIKRKKIKKLIDSMSGSLMEIFENNQNFKNVSFGHKDDFCHLRLATEEATAILK